MSWVKSNWVGLLVGVAVGHFVLPRALARLS